MGKKSKIRSGKGDLVKAPGALADQIESGNVAKERDVSRNKRQREDVEQEYIGADLSAKILKQARRQRIEEGDDDEDKVAQQKRARHISLGAASQGSDDEDDHISDNDDYDERIIQLNSKDEEDLERFMAPKEAPRTLYDIIQDKIQQKKFEAEETMTEMDGNEMHMRDLDPEVVAMYQEVGALLSRYRSGKVPKAFKIIPKMINWEQILYLTDPDKWSAAAVYQATRLFASNLNPMMCQRFYNLVLLPRIRDDIDEFKKLNFHLYQALCKALYKPAAFFKGFLLPLCESGTCTLREATIIASVLTKCSIPMFHVAAAMLKIAEMDYTGANSLFLRVLIDKKYTLPYKAIDALVNHFARFIHDTRELPVLWHQALLALVQRYKEDLNEAQKGAIYELVRAQFHYQIGPEIRRELQSLGNEAGVRTKVVDSATDNHGMEF